MRSTALYFTVILLLVLTIVAVAMMWTHLSHLRRFEGPVLYHLTSRHGVHLFDLFVLGIEMLLVLLLSIVLLSGLTRRR
jgi:hypothetical protein